MAKSIKKKPSKKKTVAKKKPPHKKTTSKIKSKNPPGLHTANEVVHERRYDTRVLSTKMTYASVSLAASEFSRPGYSFKPDISALLVDISEGGCSLVFMQSNPLSAKLAQGTQCVVQITPDAPRLVTVRWLKNLDGRLLNAGFQYES
jgi:hypothetical protein